LISVEAGLLGRLISKDGEELIARLEFDFDEVSKVAHKAK
jgi:hypothetical protein